jgi:DNA-directed RNA polymerase specialized sigma24 family protein
MEISVKAVESLVYRAKNNLQKKMENTKDWKQKIV